MYKYALVFSTEGLVPVVADQLIYVEGGYHYIEAQPVVKLDVSNKAFFSKFAQLKIAEQLVADFPIQKLRQGNCFLIPVEFVKKAKLNELLNNKDLIPFELTYEQSTKTKIRSDESSIQCLGEIILRL